MNDNSKTVIRIGLLSIILTLLTLSNGIDYEFIENPYRKYVTEYVETLEANGIDVPTQKRWTVRDEPRFFITTTIGEARGMFDDREVMVFIHPLLKLKEENMIRFVIWHELTHDIFNVRHGTTLLMKPTADRNDAQIFDVAKVLLIDYLKKINSMNHYIENKKFFNKSLPELNGVCKFAL
tara:strand:+ start:43 stop:582 length:540 start_codon:yes stop_codon:yes gene_type:complete